MGHYKSKRKKGDIEEDWLITYADSVTLILCFFVMILNVSEPKPTIFEEMRQSLMSEFSDQSESTPTTSTDMQENLQQMILNHKASNEITLEDVGNGLMLEFSDLAMFEPGSATIRDEVKPLLDDLVIELARFDYEKYRINVEGHTDDAQPAGGPFPTNWELSAARAAAVVRYFIDKQFDPTRLTASGYADTFPKRPNRDSYGQPIEENRKANRRISILLEKE